MKIYVISKSDTYDYHICAITEDREKAELLKERFTNKYGEPEIEEYDTEKCEMILRYKNTYFCTYDVYSSDIKIWEADADIDETNYSVINRDTYLFVYVNADTKETAFKIASDKFAQYIALPIEL